MRNSILVKLITLYFSLGLINVAWAHTRDYSGPLTNQNFISGTLAHTPVELGGVPTSSQGEDYMFLEICVVGNFAGANKNSIILGEDGATGIGTVGGNGIGDCDAQPTCYPIILTGSAYDVMAADGTLSLTLGPNNNINGAVCATNTVQTHLMVDHPLGECNGGSGINIQDVICTINKVLAGP